jgi:hypothetical protein
METLQVSRTTIGVALGGVVLSLLMSGWALIDSLDDEEDRRSIEHRLVCLELPGPNDCGADSQ